ncbi:hypothetical protein RIF29_15485 [Crotalaria pallida]|uniref:Uncharacterized protein n=1 Tax=Crotalaria pallida TaxID=3830 RepID=A0AAN9FEX2_CROPI
MVHRKDPNPSSHISLSSTASIKACTDACLLKTCLGAFAFFFLCFVFAHYFSPPSAISFFSLSLYCLIA